MYNPAMYLPQSSALGQFGQFSQQIPQQLTSPYQQGIDHTIKVNGKDSAYQYCQRMGPNSTSPAMFDTTHVGIMYIGTTDGAGMPTVETFDYFPHVEEQTSQQIDTSQYVNRSELDDIVRQLKEEINGIHGQPQAMPTQSVPAAINPQPIQPVAAGQTDRRG